MTGFDVFSGSVEGFDTAFVVPTLTEDAPPIVREGIARRRLATINGECPCGARRPRLNRELRRKLQREGGGSEAYSVDIEHEDDCPAIAAETVAFVRGWRWGA
jgi:hypothetical protein